MGSCVIAILWPCSVLLLSNVPILSNSILPLAKYVVHMGYIFLNAISQPQPSNNAILLQYYIGHSHHIFISA